MKISKTDKTLKFEIGMVEPVGGHGGLTHYDYSLCSGISNAGVNLTLYTCDESVDQDDLSFRLEKIFQGIYGRTPKLIRASRYFNALFRLLIDAKNKGALVVHFHFFHTSLLEWVSLNLAKVFGFKVVITAHDVESFCAGSSTRIAKSIYESADAIVAHSLVAKKELVDKLSIEPEKIATIPLGHYIGSILRPMTKKEARTELGLSDEGPYLLFFGQIKKVKGLEVLLKAMPAVLKVRPSLKLIIAGKLWKNDFTQYDALIDELNLSNSIVRHIKFIPDKSVDAYFQAADMVVFPYRKIYQSAVLLLSMSYCLPVMVSDIEGMTEVVSDGINGFTFSDGDSDDLSNKISLAIRNPKLMGSVASEGFKMISVTNDWDRLGLETAQLYRSVVR